MEIRQLRYFAAVVETGSFTKAAARCFVSQPSLSQQIAKLEEFLGQQLFERLGRTVRLTEAEAALLRALAENPGATLTRDDLAQRLDLTGNPRTVDVQVTRLRRKIEPDPRFPRYLQTVRGKGYALLPD